MSSSSKNGCRRAFVICSQFQKTMNKKFHSFKKIEINILQQYVKKKNFFFLGDCIEKSWRFN